MRRPADAPCKSCPYRLDVPSGIWDPEEYAKLPTYDGSIADQAVAGATTVFCCHTDPERLCAGWCGTHDLEENLGIRLAAVAGLLDDEEFWAAVDYESPVALFDSGAEAAAHGLREVERPSERALRAIFLLERRLERRKLDRRRQRG